MSDKQELLADSGWHGPAAQSRPLSTDTSSQQATIWPGTQQPVVIQVLSINQPVIYENYDSKNSHALGITILVCGAIAICCGVIGLVLNIYFEDCNWDAAIAYYIGTGIWCSIVTILAGAFAVVAAKTKTKCWIVAQMVLAIVGSVLAGIMFGHATWTVIHNAETLQYCRFEYDESKETVSMGALFNSLVFLLASTGQFIACIWCSTLGCKVLCCGNLSAQNVAAEQNCVNMYGRPIPGAQMIQATGTGLGHVPEAQAGQIHIPRSANTSSVTIPIGPVGQQALPVQRGAVQQPVPGTPPPEYRQVETNAVV